MKKNYEKPVLTTEQFDVEDVITASSSASTGSGTVGEGNGNWELDIPTSGQGIFH